MDKTGRALGTLRPVIYLENAEGHLLLLPEEIGQGDHVARRIYEERYKAQGYEWREAGTLADVDRLQRRLIEQETRLLKSQAETVDGRRENVRGEVASNLRARMTHADCSAFEREFIRLWLDIREEKRKEFTQRFEERNMYLWAREMDERTQVEDRMGS